MRKTAFFLAIMILLSAGPALAAEMVLWGVYGGLSMGAVFLPMENLNEYLAPLRIDDFSPTIPIVGADIYAVLGERLVAGWQGFIFMQHETGERADAQLAGGAGNLYIGLNVYETADLRLRPEFGIGGSLLNLTLNENEDRFPRKFHDLTIPAGCNQLFFSRGALEGRVAFTAEWTPAIYQTSNGLLGLAVSLSAGLEAPLLEDDWQIRAHDSREHERSTLTGDGPALHLLAPYVLLGVKFGGGITETDKE